MPAVFAGGATARLRGCAGLAQLTGLGVGYPLAVPIAGAFWQATGFTALLTMTYLYEVQHYA